MNKRINTIKHLTAAFSVLFMLASCQTTKDQGIPSDTYDQTNKIEITSQNDQYAVDIESLKNTDLKPTHQNVIDGIIAGVEDKKNKVIAVQYNPSPSDSDDYVFRRFINLLGGKKNA